MWLLGCAECFSPDRWWHRTFFICLPTSEVMDSGYIIGFNGIGWDINRV
jgi:hypothetical protein